jgi:hypothetical protein
LRLVLEQPLEAGTIGPQRSLGGSQQQWLGKTGEPARPTATAEGDLGVVRDRLEGAAAAPPQGAGDRLDGLPAVGLAILESRTG